MRCLLSAASEPHRLPACFISVLFNFLVNNSHKSNKEAVLSQVNRAMPDAAAVLFDLKFAKTFTTSLRVP